MANRNITSPTAAKIFAAWQKQGQSETPRSYLGASIIGHECDRWLWYNFRGAVREVFEGRMYRLFDRGRREEEVFCSDLRRIGIEVREFDENGNQFEVLDLGGHFGGHLDGVARGFDEAPTQWFVVEFKTHSKDSFKKLVKEGVKIAKPQHYAQMQTYMGYTGLSKAFYFAVNKDDDDLWCETIDFCPSAFENIKARANHIISTCEPSRCSSRPDDFRCKLCAAKTICWHTHPTIVDSNVPVSCRTCIHSTAVTNEDGRRWECRLGKSCSETCDNHVFIPVFVNGTVVDGSMTHIRYKTESGDEFVNGGSFMSSKELRMTMPDGVASIMQIKSALPQSQITSSHGNIMERIKSCGLEETFSGTVQELRRYLKSMPTDDWSKPLNTDEVDDCRYFEYPNNVIVSIRGDSAKVYKEPIPF